VIQSQLSPVNNYPGRRNLNTDSRFGVMSCVIAAEGCDIGHLVQGVGRKGLTSLFSNLGILAWTVTLADTVTVAAPWIEHSPLFTYIAEKSSHEVAHAIISAQRLIVRLLP